MFYYIFLEPGSCLCFSWYPNEVGEEFNKGGFLNAFRGNSISYDRWDPRDISLLYYAATLWMLSRNALSPKLLRGERVLRDDTKSGYIEEKRNIS